MANTCGDCLFIKDIEGSTGKCKVVHAETHITPDASNRTMRRDNGWPKVNVTEAACGEFQVAS